MRKNTKEAKETTRRLIKAGLAVGILGGGAATAQVDAFADTGVTTEGDAPETEIDVTDEQNPAAVEEAAQKQPTQANLNKDAEDAVESFEGLVDEITEAKEDGDSLGVIDAVETAEDEFDDVAGKVNSAAETDLVTEDENGNIVKDEDGNDTPDGEADAIVKIGEELIQNPTIDGLQEDVDATKDVLGAPSEKDEEGNVTKEAKGAYADLEAAQEATNTAKEVLGEEGGEEGAYKDFADAKEKLTEEAISVANDLTLTDAQQAILDAVTQATIEGGEVIYEANVNQFDDDKTDGALVDGTYSGKAGATEAINAATKVVNDLTSDLSAAQELLLKIEGGKDKDGNVIEPTIIIEGDDENGTLKNSILDNLKSTIGKIETALGDEAVYDEDGNVVTPATGAYARLAEVKALADQYNTLLGETREEEIAYYNAHQNKTKINDKKVEKKDVDEKDVALAQGILEYNLAKDPSITDVEITQVDAVFEKVAGLKLDPKETKCFNVTYYKNGEPVSEQYVYAIDTDNQVHDRKEAGVDVSAHWLELRKVDESTVKTKDNKEKVDHYEYKNGNETIVVTDLSKLTADKKHYVDQIPDREYSAGWNSVPGYTVSGSHWVDEADTYVGNVSINGNVYLAAYDWYYGQWYMYTDTAFTSTKEVKFKVKTVYEQIIEKVEVKKSTKVADFDEDQISFSKVVVTGDRYDIAAMETAINQYNYVLAKDALEEAKEDLAEKKAAEAKAQEYVNELELKIRTEEAMIEVLKNKPEPAPAPASETGNASSGNENYDDSSSASDEQAQEERGSVLGANREQPVEETVVEEGGKVLGAERGRSPKTGDAANVLGAVATMGSSLVGAGAVLGLRRRNK